jgi:DNA-binding NarL/FixJ family response regulator
VEDICLLAILDDLEQAVQAVLAQRPAVFLVGQAPGTRSILPLLNRLLRYPIRSGVIAWAECPNDPESYRLLNSGARGVVTRRHAIPDFLECLRTVAAGEVWFKPFSSTVKPSALPEVRLTGRETEVARLAAKGLRNRQIAEALNITPGTVKVHLQHVFEKAGVRSRIELTSVSRDLLGAAERVEEQRT